MSARRLVFALSAGLAASMLPALSLAGPWTPAPGEYYSQFEGGLLSTASAYDGKGLRTTLGAHIEQRTLSSTTELGWKKHASVVIGVPVVSLTERVSSVAFDRTETGFSNLLLGVRFRLANGATGASLALEWEAPLGYNRRLNPSLGDGLQELGVGLDLGTALAHVGFFEVSGGYHYRYLVIGSRKNTPVVLDDTQPPPDARRDAATRTSASQTTSLAQFEWADQARLGADLGFWIGPSLLIGGRYAGVITVKEGPVYPVLNLHEAGPVLLYRLDDHLDLKAGSFTTVSGRNALHFSQVYVAIAFKQTKLNRLQGFLGGKQRP